MPIDRNPIADNKEIAHRFMDECWNLGKMDSLREMVATGCRIHDPVFPALTSGAGNFARHISMCRNGFPDLNFTIDDTIAERNEVVLHWTARGTHRGVFLGMQPTNRSATVSGTSIFRIDDCMIVEMWADWNLMTLMNQLGAAVPQRVEAKV
ncbi:MAG: ester cyclase [Acidobacteria bacterium]|nr:ester cyclase [Acidobacteriota bacterium]